MAVGFFAIQGDHILVSCILVNEHDIGKFHDTFKNYHDYQPKQDSEIRGKFVLNKRQQMAPKPLPPHWHWIKALKAFVIQEKQSDPLMDIYRVWNTEGEALILLLSEEYAWLQKIFLFLMQILLSIFAP